MYRISLAPIFLMGNNLGVLMNHVDSSPDYTFNDLARDSSSVIQSLRQWGTDTIVSAPLSKEAAYPTFTLLNEFSTAEHLKDHGAKVLPADIKGQILTQIHIFISLLLAEINSGDLYSISQKRGHNMAILIFAAERNLDESVIQNLPPECIEEIREAGRCIAFDLPTASGFHINRALEMVILLYFPVLDIPIPDEKKRSWGNYINLLDGRELNGNERIGATKVDEKIIGMLKHLKDFYRNPLMHPEWTLKDQEAQNLFNVAISAISAMVSDIVARKSESPVDQDERKES